jgi:hypothetical protein
MDRVWCEGVDLLFVPELCSTRGGVTYYISAVGDVESHVLSCYDGYSGKNQEHTINTRNRMPDMRTSGFQMPVGNSVTHTWDFCKVACTRYDVAWFVE